jgi:hypothetical protein
MRNDLLKSLIVCLNHESLTKIGRVRQINAASAGESLRASKLVHAATRLATKHRP